MAEERRLDVAVLIAARNEAETIAATVTSALRIPEVTRAVVVDDGSDDETARLAEDAGARVVRMAGNAGKGGALEAGLKRVENADILVLLDGDLGPSAAEAAKLIEPVRAGQADMTIATLPATGAKAGFGLVKRLARWGIRTLGSERFDPQAPLSGQRAILGSRLPELRPLAAGFGVEVALSVRALRAGMTLLEVPTQMTHSATGRDLSGFVHRGRQFVHVGIALLKLAFSRRS